HRQLTLLVRGERLLGEAKTFQLLEILSRQLRSVPWHRLTRHRPIGRVLDFVDDLRQLAWMDAGDGRHRPKAPPQLVQVAVELDAHGANGIDLGVERFVCNVDVAKTGDLSNLIVA